MADKMKKAVVLLSGGLDSATTLAIAKEKGFQCCYGLTFSYGQRHRTEIDHAKKVAKALGVVEHKIIDIDLKQFGSSALTDDNIEVPKDRKGLSDKEQAIPITYVPARNLIFLSYAAAWEEVLGAFDIFIGVNAMDYSGYPDCRGEFITSFQQTVNLATAASIEGKGKFTIWTPIIEMTKAQIILKGTQLGVDYSLTHSCYDPVDGKACGRCDSCRIRLKGFSDAEIKDPVEYA